MAGATAVAVGAMNFHDPDATVNVLDGILKYMEQYKVEDINELRGIV